MTSIFEVLSNQARLAEDDHSNARDEKDQSAIQTKKEDELTSEKYFMICKTCFWCASYIDIMDTNSLPYKVCPICPICPICNHTSIELIPLSDGEAYSFGSLLFTSY